MRGIFVTGTDTGVGKTVISGLLGRYLSNKGFKVITQKWAQTGAKGFGRDTDLHLRLMRKERKDITPYLTCISPYTFGFASSPHLAAAIEGRRIDVDKIKRSCRTLTAKFDFVIVEGIGGALVPLTRKRLVIDIAKELNLPVLIVAGNRLGAINHTLLTVEAVRRRNMRIIGIVFNNLNTNVNKMILKDNVDIIGRVSGERILGVLAYIKDKELLYKSFVPIGRKVAAWIRG